MSDASDKNPAAVALGRLGGKAGGAARAAKLSPEQRRELARRAALSRWGMKPPPAPTAEAAAGGDVRERVMAQAAAMFAAQGYASVNMRELARRAGVGLPTIYALFGDKSRLYLEAWLQSLEDYTATLRQSVSGLQEGAEAVYGFCLTICQINTDPARPRLLQNHRLSADDPIFVRIADRVFNRQFGILRASVARLCGEAEADIKTYSIYALAHGMTQLSPVSQHSALGLPSARDPEGMALRALAVVFPEIDWPAVAKRTRRRLARARS